MERIIDNNRRPEYERCIKSLNNMESVKEDNTTTELSDAMQALLMSRRTVSKLVHTTSADAPAVAENHEFNMKMNSRLTRENEDQLLMAAMDRAVRVGQMAPNHKQTEPFSFRRFLWSSQSARALADICFQVTLARKGSEPLARKKREKWAQIPAFLVTLVHENQEPLEAPQQTTGDTLNDPSLFEALEYLPPNTERQLEDVS
jgi:hypothetical protein